MLISANSGYYSARPGKPRYDMVNEAVDFLADVGFEAVDVNFSAVIRKDEIGGKSRETILDDPDNLRRLVEKAKLRGLAIHTSHLPFFKYYKDIPEFDEYQALTLKSLDAVAKIGAEWTVVHVAPTVDDTVKYVRGLCEAGNPNGVGLAIENSPKTTIEVLCESIDTLAAEGYKVGCCFDTGHANYAGLSQMEALTKLGGRVKMLHVHDNYGDRDAHQAPLAGNINWDETMRALARIGYTGDFNYEITAAALPENARRNYALYCIDLAKWLLGIYEDERRKIILEKGN